MANHGASSNEGYPYVEEDVEDGEKRKATGSFRPMQSACRDLRAGCESRYI